MVLNSGAAPSSNQRPQHLLKGLHALTFWHLYTYKLHLPRFLTGFCFLPRAHAKPSLSMITLGKLCCDEFTPLLLLFGYKYSLQLSCKKVLVVVWRYQPAGLLCFFLFFYCHWEVKLFPFVCSFVGLKELVMKFGREVDHTEGQGVCVNSTSRLKSITPKQTITNNNFQKVFQLFSLYTFQSDFLKTCHRLRNYIKLSSGKKSITLKLLY